MVQVKKAEVREAIVDGAYRVFREKGYNAASITLLGQVAGIAPSNIYAYFGSKLELFFAVYEPWIHKQFGRLEAKLTGLDDRRERLVGILEFLWIDLPTHDNGFANNLIQAVSNASPKESLSSDLLEWCEGTLCRLMQEGEAKSHARLDQLSHILLMAFGGFAIRHHLNAVREDVDELIQSVADRLLAGWAGDEATRCR
ncbi:TetR/AcrR family transcriptional regulator [Sphingosinicella rhizophila]|uniref:TetR/AcrR family transcriptional regulator n=1 Tax=Sphingosinicella rhizophila TaxID=3050082 RepID=A0ABU3Q4J5_9SPHN|nr:TetR/AcrR family transcriptional regulator [Sphingosinicella sp. GR2756]MDT9598335.1 TetR/AcrR family transcriptional regulator [Sphingosinicella sp. GR2756]